MADKGLLRSVYLAELHKGAAKLGDIASARAENRQETRRKLEEAAREGLVRMEGSTVRFTPKGRGQLSVIMIGGAFEIIHPGHVHTIGEAKKLGDTLVAVVAADSTVRKNKGREPVTPQEWRVKLVSSLRDVDAAVPGGLGSIYDTMEKVKPDIVALGYDQWHNPKDIEDEARKRGMKLRVVRLASPIPEVKTSKIVGTL